VTDVVLLLTALAAVACGLAAGAFLAFSAFVLPALDALDDEGLAAMRSVNSHAVRPPFMVALFGPAVACLGLAVWSVASWGAAGSGWVLAGAVAYVLGAVGVTVTRNVPLNDRMAALPASGGSGEWHELAGSWLRWNHVRLLLTAAGAALLTAGAVVMS